MLSVDLEVSIVEHHIEQMEIQSPTTTKYASLKKSSTILVLGYNPALNQGLVNLFLALDSSNGNAFSVSNKETYSKNGLHIHQLTLSFAASRDVRELNEDEAESQPDSRTQELVIDTISTPGISSGQMKSAGKPLRDLLMHGIIDDICFVHDKEQAYRGFEDPAWLRWLRFLQRRPNPANVFVVRFGDGIETPKIDHPLAVSGIRTIYVKGAMDSTPGLGFGPDGPHAAEKLLQTIVMDKLISTELGQNSQAIPTLRNYHRALYEAGHKICDFLETRIDEARKSSSSMQFDIGALQPLLDASTMLAQQADNRIVELDTEDLEPMEPVTGLTSIFYQHRIWHVGPPPSFSFDVTTPFPIRAVVRGESDHSTWIPSGGPALGTCKFIAEVRNEKRATSWAKVELFGWRKEIYAKELADTRRLATEQKCLMVQLFTSIESTTLQWSQAESTIEDLSKQLNDAKTDMSLITCCELQEWDFETLYRCLKEKSVYGVAKAYGLNSLVKKSFFPSVPKDETVYKAFEEYIQRLSGVIQYLDSSLESLEKLDKQNFEAADQQANSFENLKALVAQDRSSTDRGAKISELASSRTAIERNIGEAGAKIFAELEKEFDEICADISNSMNEIEEKGSAEIFEWRGVGASARDDIEAMRLETVRDQESANKVLNMMSSNVMDIGTLATLSHQADLMSAWWSIWRGVRLCNIGGQA